MKVVLLIFVTIFFQSVLSADNTVSCVFPNQSEQMILENCAVKSERGVFKILKPALAKIKFDSKGLAGGSILTDGCYWLNSKGLLLKTHCFDNGADYFEDGFARYIDAAGKFGYMNQELEVKIRGKYTFAFPFQRGYAKVCMNCVKEKSKDSEHTLVTGGKWMIINKDGKTIKSCKNASKEYECLVPSN